MQGYLVKSNSSQVLSNNSSTVTSWIYQEGTEQDSLSIFEDLHIDNYSIVQDAVSLLDIPKINVYLSVTDDTHLSDTDTGYVYIGVVDTASLSEEISLSNLIPILDNLGMSEAITDTGTSLVVTDTFVLEDSVYIRVSLSLSDSFSLLDEDICSVLVGILDNANLSEDDPIIEALIPIEDSISLIESLGMWVFLTVDDFYRIIDIATRKQKRIIYLRSRVPGTMKFDSFTSRQMRLLSNIPTDIKYRWDINLKDWIEN